LRSLRYNPFFHKPGLLSLDLGYLLLHNKYLRVWALVGNDEDGLFGERGGYVRAPTHQGACFWALRNPLHNVTFHVIGTAGETNHSAFTLLSLGTKRISGCHTNTLQYVKGAGLNIQLHDVRPFISFHLPVWKNREFTMHTGWCERGNFGLSLRPWQKRHDD